MYVCMYVCTYVQVCAKAKSFAPTSEANEQMLRWPLGAPSQGKCLAKGSDPGVGRDCMSRTFLLTEAASLIPCERPGRRWGERPGGRWGPQGRGCQGDPSEAESRVAAVLRRQVVPSKAGPKAFAVGNQAGHRLAISRGCH